MFAPTPSPRGEGTSLQILGQNRCDSATLSQNRPCRGGDGSGFCVVACSVVGELLLLALGHVLDQAWTQVPFSATLDTLVPEAAMINSGRISAIGQHLVLSVGHQLASCADLLPQIQRAPTATVLSTSSTSRVLRVVPRERSIRSAFDSIRDTIGAHQVNVRVLDTSNGASGGVDRVLIRFFASHATGKTLSEFNQLILRKFIRQCDLMFTVGSRVGSFMPVCHAPELSGFISGPSRKVPVAGVNQIVARTVGALPVDVSAVSACRPLLAALDAVVEACHWRFTLSRCVNEKGRQDCSCRPAWNGMVR